MRLPRPGLHTAPIAGAVGLACLVLVAAAPAATEPAKNGSIAFSGKRGGTRAIYARESNGTHLRVLPTRGRADHPAFSAQGRRLLFTRYGGLGAQVWVTYLNGTGSRSLTSGPADGMAQWSPTGEEVVFARGRRGHRDLYRVAADGSDLRRLTFSRRDDHSPSWSAKDRIAFVRHTEQGDHVYLIGANGGPARRLTRRKPQEVAPAWSRTGRTLVVARGRRGRRDLYSVNAAGTRFRRLTRVAGDDSDPAWSPDASRIVFSHSRGGKRRLFLMKVRGAAVRRLPSRGRRVRRLTTSGSAARLPSWQPTGFSPVVAAAGDIACDPNNPNFNNGLGVPGTCRQKLTSDLLLRPDLASIFALGDNQYEDGQLWKFQRSFDPSWGRLKPLIRPVAGNHEYGIANASGYFDYFNGVGRSGGPAGARNAGYYSFEVGSWHVIALNSECEHIGGCGASSPQIRWLATDLATHPVACTVALWHRPHFTSGGHSDKGDMLPAWTLLYGANADLILNGHDHFYERFAPQTPTGAVDPARGIREFIIGVGGKSRFGFTDPQPNSDFQENDFYGFLQLSLREGRYDWTARAAPTGRQVDAGSETCH